MNSIVSFVVGCIVGYVVATNPEIANQAGDLLQSAGTLVKGNTQ